MDAEMGMSDAELWLPRSRPVLAGQNSRTVCAAVQYTLPRLGKQCFAGLLRGNCNVL